MSDNFGRTTSSEAPNKLKEMSRTDEIRIDLEYNEAEVLKGDLCSRIERKQMADIRYLLEEIARLRKALEWYADADRYRIEWLQEDLGRRAKNALDGKEER